MLRKEQRLQQIFRGLHLLDERENLCNLKMNTCPFLRISLYKLDTGRDNRNPALTAYFGLSLRSVHAVRPPSFYLYTSQRYSAQFPITAAQIEGRFCIYEP